MHPLQNRCVHLTLYCALAFSSLFANAWSQDKQSTPQALEALIRGTVVDQSGSPVANAKIQSLAYREQDRRQTESLRNGAFVLRIPADSPFGHALLVTDAADELAGFVGQYSYKIGDRNPLQVVLRPWKTTSVTVIDSQSQPVVGATVYLIADHGELGNTKTDQAGVATLRFPADAKVDWILAYKSSQGFDYYENYKGLPSQERLPVPPQITLSLTGAVSAVIEVVDSDDNPVPNVSVVPWNIFTENKISVVNMSGLGIATTDDNGQATFDWLPRNLKGRITFLVHSEKYHCDVNPVYILNTEETTTRTARVKRVATLSDHTETDAQGKYTFPAIAIGIRGEISAPLLLGRGQVIEFKVLKAEAQKLAPIVNQAK